MYTGSLLPIFLYFVVTAYQFHVTESLGGKWIQQETASTFGGIDQKFLDKHYVLREQVAQQAHLSPHRWQPSNYSQVVPFLDRVGVCTAATHMIRTQQKHSGGILFIGDDTEALATMKLASVLEPHMTSLSCSSKACTYSVCGKDVVTKLSYLSMKKFMHDSCIHSDAHKNQCDDKIFAATMSNYDTIVFGMSPVVAKIHTTNAANDVAHEVKAMANWMNSNFTSILKSAGKQGTSLFLYQTAWPTEMYCTAGDSGRKKERYQQLQAHDQFLWKELSAGPFSQVKGLTVQKIDLSEAVTAREELLLRDGTNSRVKLSNCEQFSSRSDSIQLLLNTVYGAILDHVRPRSFPHVTPGLLGKEDYAKAIQRVALTEVSVINYLSAQHRIQTARQNGWRLPQDTAVTLTLTDIRYHAHFPYWYHSRRQYNVEGIMIGMDNETCNHLVRHFQDFLYLCMHVPETMRMAPPYKQTVFVGVGKIIYPLLFLVEHNMPVIFSEMDVFWRNNPYPFFAQEDRKVYDVEVSAHVGFNNKKHVTTMPKELNIGFFYARPTPLGRVLFVDLLHFLLLMPFASIDKVTADQKLFDRFIRNVPAPAGEEQPCMGELFVGWEKVRPAQHFEGFKWARLPGALFTHNDVDELAILPETLTYHISWGVDPPSRRVYCAHTLGLLPTNYTATTQFAQQTCFKYLYK